MARKYEEAPRGHTWKRDEDGRLDIFAYENGHYCNGPACISCGYGFCHHCEKGPDEECTKPILTCEFREAEQKRLAPNGETKHAND